MTGTGSGEPNVCAVTCIAYMLVCARVLNERALKIEVDVSRANATRSL